MDFRQAVPYATEAPEVDINGINWGFHHTAFNAYLEEDPDCVSTPWLCMDFPRTVSGSVTVREARVSDPPPGGDCPTWPPTDPVTFSLGHVTAAPGQTDVSLPVSISVKPRALPVSGWGITVHYDPRVLAQVSLESARPADFWLARNQEDFVEEGMVSLAVDYVVRDAPRGEWITSLNDGVIANLRFCVLPEALPGTYPIHFPGQVTLAIPPARVRDVIDHATVYQPGGMVPLLDPGSVTIAGEPQGGGCQADVRPQARFKATFALTDAAATPGGSVLVPFLINPGAAADGFSFSVSFDEEVLQATGIEKLFALPDGTTDYGFEVLKFSNANQTPGDAGVDEGFLAGAVIFSTPRLKATLPPDRDNPVLAFRFQVTPQAKPGTTTEIRFQDGAVPPGGAVPVPNVLTIEGRSVLPGLDVGYVYLPGRIAIVGDVSIFVRGDSNGDEHLDVSDPQFTLSYLFLSGKAPACLDAADANDDGSVNVSDPVGILNMLFLGGTLLPPPGPRDCGADPTPDGLGCTTKC